jgi:hypothetical protein
VHHSGLNAMWTACKIEQAACSNAQRKLWYIWGAFQTFGV